MWSVVRRVPFGDGRLRVFGEEGFAFDRREVEVGVVVAPIAFQYDVLPGCRGWIVRKGCSS